MWEFCQTKGTGALLAYGCYFGSKEWPIITPDGYEIAWGGLPFGLLDGGQIAFNLEDGSVMRWQYCQNDCQTGN